MVYCRNCGSEMNEKAVICVKCGVPISEEVFSSRKSTIAKNTTNQRLIVNPWTFWLSIFTYLLGLISLVLLVHSVIYISVYSSATDYYSILVAAPYAPLLLGAFIMSCLTFASSIAVFIVGIINTVEKKLSETEYYMFIIAFCLGITVFISGMCAFLI